MRTLELPKNASARTRGRAHGEAFRAEIREIAAIRTELAVEQGLLANEAQVLRVAELHLPVLAAFDALLCEELLGIADGADVPAAQIVVLNHYTDLKDLGPEVLSPHDEDCSALVAKGRDHHVVLAQTWDMHGSAAPFVTMLHVPEHEGRPACWMLTITGCLGMTGMNADGVGVTINNLKSRDARVGVVWPALVRRMLAEREAEAAKHVLMTAPMSSGHHYLVASAERAYGIETSGVLKDVVWESRFGAHETYVHTNHCLGETIGSVSWISDTSTTRERYDRLAQSLAERPIEDARDVWARLGSHDGYPRSICTHLASEQDPHAMLTCAGILMDLTLERLYAAPGCIHGAEPIHFSFEDR